MQLADYLRITFRNGITYRDAAHLCLAMYCVDNILPTGAVDDKLSMEVIAEAFADIARHGLIKEYVSYESVPFGANYHSIEDKGHWVEVQASVLKKGMTYEIERVERLKKSMLSGKDI